MTPEGRAERHAPAAPLAPLVLRGRTLLGNPFLVPVLVCLVACGEAARLVLGRLQFPYDLFMWSESPFMTNMLKLGSGEPIYGPPELANSFVYPPGLELLCYALLHPFGRDLDVRFCRAVVVALGAAAAILASSAAVSLHRREPSLLARASAALLAWLLILQHLTSDVLHPDTLHLAHATACLVLSLRVMERRSQRAAIAAAILAGLGVLVKQTEGASLVGVLAISGYVFGLRSAELKRAFAAGLISMTLAAGWLFSNPDARFQLFTVLSRHPIIFSRLSLLYGIKLPYQTRPIFVALAVWAVVRLVRRGNGRAVLGWAILGVTCTLPNLLSFMKMMGGWNSFEIIDLWLFIPLWSLLVAEPRKLGGRVRVALVFALGAWLLRCTKHVPSDAYIAHYRATEARVSADLASGKRVLVGQGAAMLIHAGVRAAPRDREGSILELGAAGLESLTGTAARFDAGAYDRVYLSTTWMGPPLRAALERRYVMEQVLEPPGGPGRHAAEGIWQDFGRVEVWVLR